MRKIGIYFSGVRLCRNMEVLEYRDNKLHWKENDSYILSLVVFWVVKQIM